MIMEADAGVGAAVVPEAPGVGAMTDVLAVALPELAAAMVLALNGPGVGAMTDVLADGGAGSANAERIEWCGRTKLAGNQPDYRNECLRTEETKALTLPLSSEPCHQPFESLVFNTMTVSFSKDNCRDCVPWYACLAITRSPSILSVSAIEKYSHQALMATAGPQLLCFVPLLPR